MSFSHHGCVTTEAFAKVAGDNLRDYGLVGVPAGGTAPVQRQLTSDPPSALTTHAGLQPGFAPSRSIHQVWLFALKTAVSFNGPTCIQACAVAAMARACSSVIWAPSGAGVVVAIDWPATHSPR